MRSCFTYTLHKHTISWNSSCGWLQLSFHFSTENRRYPVSLCQIKEISVETLQHDLRKPLDPDQWEEMPSFFQVKGSIRSSRR